MKKKILIIVVLLAIIAVVLFAYQSKINNEINSKIDELNNNGFIVKHQQSTNYINTSAKGEIEVAYPDKVAFWIFNGVKDEELKKAIEEQYNSLAPNDKELLFSGIKFDYDFVLENLTSKVNTNIYLTQLSKIAMNNLAQETDNQSSKWLLDFLKDKKLQVSVNEKKEYKVADIDTIIPDENIIITIRGFQGNEKNLTINSFKISDMNMDNRGLLLINEIAINYEKEANKESSKTLIKNIEFQEKNNIFNIKNLVINSNYEKDEININTKSELGFEELTTKSFDQEAVNLKNTSLSFNINNLPIKKLDEITLYLKDQKYEEYLKSLAQSGMVIESSGNASNYVINQQKILDTLKFNLSFKLNKNMVENEPKDLTDIFEDAKLTVDLDALTAQNAKALLDLKQNSNISFLDVDNNLKRFEAVLKNDGLYINNQRILEKNELAIPSKDNTFQEEVITENTTDDLTTKKISQKSLTYNYKLLNDNLLELNIKYTPDMKVVSSGGISVSFPQFTDAKRIIKNTTTSFEIINFYDAGSQIWNGGLEQNIVSSYLLAEGWDNNWMDGKDKELTLIIDVKDLETLEIYLRAGALNEKDALEKPSEIVPQTGEFDQQNYPVEILEIPIFRVR
ncbi:hypothetical protein CKA55_06645 [Arcobacter suis]|uniref:DUF945 domain-containing protein n=1 Tax=Arcobacter suis CECT 7833 TaxID=663365 RepID=A0AAD0SY50_9BACT|nr:hypothetical protein [Arcobacter suis]AXX89582.1 hypothetical protein ASUIS_1094 [Arcobacter suis CECT 7833]RWS46681.1 hypothetical protein CKA55_06645 [Arcobacter suis]